MATNEPHATAVRAELRDLPLLVKGIPDEVLRAPVALR